MGSRRREKALVAAAAALTGLACAGSSATGSVGRVWNGPLVGYASEVSVRPGQVLHLHVSANPPRSYRVDIRRRGWYSGRGSKRLACLPSCGGWAHGKTFTVRQPTSTGEVNAAWPVTESLRIPRGWSTGSYVALLRLRKGPQQRSGLGNLIPFIVRPRRPHPRAALVVMPVNTWQAYNSWGGKSLYPGSSSGGVPANHVSFQRPYFFNWDWELPAIRFLERERYRLEYTTDVDVDRHPKILLQHKLVIVPGHSEYWTKGMRDAFDAARRAGVNLAFLGANDSYWQARYADDRRTIVEYKSSTRDPQPNPALKTDRFRKLKPPRPECQLMGIQYQGSEQSGVHAAAFQVNTSALHDSWFAGTGFRQNRQPLPGLVYQEWDSVTRGCKTPPLTVFFRYTGARPAATVRFRAPSGALVFSAGSLGFARGLDPREYPDVADTRLARFMENALAALGATRAPAPRTSSSPGTPRSAR